MISICRPMVPLITIVVSMLAACASNPLALTAEVRQALAPTGKLRVGMYHGSPTSMIRDPKTGEMKGVTLELGQELARRLGVPFESVVFQRPAEVVDGLKSGKADITFTNASPARAKDIDFTPPLLDIEQGFLVLSGSPVSTSALPEVDRPEIRVGVSQGSTSLNTLSREFKHAKLVQIPNLKIAIEMLTQRQVDAFASNKAILNELSDELPGSRVLAGRFGLEHVALGIPKGRDQGMGYLRKFAEDMMSGGNLKRAVETAGLRGTVKPDSN
jgi:polar amino acid transport system substrate-binding protein